MTVPDHVPIRDLARELNVSVQALRDLARAGHIVVHDDLVTKDSADDVRWKMAFAGGR